MHFLHHIIDYCTEATAFYFTQLYSAHLPVSNLLSYKVYESSDKINSFFILCLAQYFKLLLKKY